MDLLTQLLTVFYFTDNLLGFTILALFGNAISVVGTVVGIAYSTPIFLVIVIPIAILYYFVQVILRVISMSMCACVSAGYVYFGFLSIYMLLSISALSKHIYPSVLTLRLL